MLKYQDFPSKIMDNENYHVFSRVFTVLIKSMQIIFTFLNSKMDYCVGQVRFLDFAPGKVLTEKRRLLGNRPRKKKSAVPHVLFWQIFTEQSTMFCIIDVTYILYSIQKKFTFSTLEFGLLHNVAVHQTVCVLLLSLSNSDLIFIEVLTLDTINKAVNIVFSYKFLLMEEVSTE